MRQTEIPRLMQAVAAIVFGTASILSQAAEMDWPTIEVMSPKQVQSTGGCINPVAERWQGRLASLTEAIGTDNQQPDLADKARDKSPTRMPGEQPADGSGLPAYLLGGE